MLAGDGGGLMTYWGLLQVDVVRCPAVILDEPPFEIWDPAIPLM